MQTQHRLVQCVRFSMCRLWNDKSKKYTYGNGNNNVSIEHYKVINGEHVWFDIDYEGANTDKLIWDFVSRYDINGLR